jgi:hypothetical protein
MDRRMYRGNRENSGPCNRVSPGRFTSEDKCDRDMSDHESDFDRFPLGMCYVPWQCFRNLYENEFVALAHGTLFKDLDLDFLGRSCK